MDKNMEEIWFWASEDEPEEDRNCLCCYLDDQLKWSMPHKCYYMEGHFFSLENNNSHPLVCDKWSYMPYPPKIQNNI